MMINPMNHHLYRVVGADPRDYLYYRAGSGNTVEIYDICVGSERRTGVGRRLLMELFRELAPTMSVWAFTRADNQIAHEFYEACGFRLISSLRGFYDPTHPEMVDARLYGRTAGGPV